MSFGCPICWEKLDQFPGESNQAHNGNDQKPKVSAAPCGHMFHTYCIEKSLEGHLAFNKQCPYCRKAVSKTQCLGLFPFSVNSDGPSDAAVPTPCNHPEVTALERQVNLLQEEVNIKEQKYQVLSSGYTTVLNYYSAEKATSHEWMMKAQEYQTKYENLASKHENKMIEVENQLKQYARIEAILDGLEDNVKLELSDFPPTMDSVKALLQMSYVFQNRLKHYAKVEAILAGHEDDVKREMTYFPPSKESVNALIELKLIYNEELRNRNGKLDEVTKNYRTLMIENVELEIENRRKKEELKDLRRVLENLRNQGKIRGKITSPPSVRPLLFSKLGKVNVKERGLRLKQPLPASPAHQPSPDLDPDVELFPSPFVEPEAGAAENFSVPKLVKIVKKSPSKLEKNDKPSNNNSEEMDVMRDDEELKIRVSVPGAPLPLSSKRFKILQEKAEKPKLGGSSRLKFKADEQKRIFDPITKKYSKK